MPAGECPQSFSAIQPFGFEFSQSEKRLDAQAVQPPQASCDFGIVDGDHAALTRRDDLARVQ